ncbi:hypothetical protein BDB01DRAFT_842899 [Pilobolus umbonatus]|nr:hypothetical protein BDB01DRAFT_842899 [Pilobolus umbonatus]
MGKLVTYAIGYTTVSPYAQEIKDLTRHYERELKQNRYNKAAHIAQCLAETILEGLDVVDPDLPESEVERDRMKAIKKVAEYSTFSVKYFDQETEQEDMAKMKAYDLAIKCSHRSLSFIVDKESNKVATQRAYKLIGDIYFTKACDPRAARYDDLINSKKSYLLEKKVLDTMDREDVDKDPEVWMNLKRMSYFNLGVIESKLYTSPVTAMECLTEAIELAKKLGDHGSQREAWWEMANFYKRTDDYVKIKQCLMKEMEIIRQYNLVEHEVACLMERSKWK